MAAWTRNDTASRGSLEKSMAASLVRFPLSTQHLFTHLRFSCQLPTLPSIPIPLRNSRRSRCLCAYLLLMWLNSDPRTDLYLIRPPEDSKHRPVKPEHIIIMGDSAGGGLSLALLQVIRDSGLPAPASGVLVSPWCDMSHSFPSIHENTATVSHSIHIDQLLKLSIRM